VGTDPMRSETRGELGRGHARASLFRARVAASRLRLAAPWGGIPLERKEGIEPFFIVGAGRSGMTLLRRMLMADGGVFIPPETYVLGTIITNFRLLHRLPWKTIVTQSLAQLEYHPEFVHFGTSLRPLVAALRSAPPERQSLAYLLDQFYRFVASESGWPASVRWGDKTPKNSYHLDAIRSVFPNARFIHLIRDGYDVIDSSARVPGTIRHGDPIESAWHWRRSVRACREFGDRFPASYLEVKYETLVGDPEAQLRRLCGFINLRYSSTMLELNPATISRMGDVPALDHHANVGSPVSTRFVGNGRISLAPDVLCQVTPVISEDMWRFGYRPLATTERNGATDRELLGGLDTSPDRS
jgi:protein-tyrosine sulfotransferase